jgi:hypothetical protein
MRFPWLRSRHPAFARNRPILRSPVMARFDALFADVDANARIYPSILSGLDGPMTAEHLREVLAEHSPDSSVQGVGASADDVVTHVFDHILGKESWWGPVAAEWRGGELLTAAYRDAILRAQAAGNVPIKTFHLQASPDDQFQVQVLDAGRVIVVIVATPPVPSSVPNPEEYKAQESEAQTFAPVDDGMPEVGSFTVETVRRG